MKVLGDLRSDSLCFSDATGREAVPATISWWEGIALEIRDQLVIFWPSFGDPRPVCD
jgi:hypothetical protein